jgi:hypothetical protein
MRAFRYVVPKIQASVICIVEQDQPVLAVTGQPIQGVFL